MEFDPPVPLLRKIGDAFSFAHLVRDFDVAVVAESAEVTRIVTSSVRQRLYVVHLEARGVGMAEDTASMVAGYDLGAASLS